VIGNTVGHERRRHVEHQAVFHRLTESSRLAPLASTTVAHRTQRRRARCPTRDRRRLARRELRLDVQRAHETTLREPARDHERLFDGVLREVVALSTPPRAIVTR